MNIVVTGGAGFIGSNFVRYKLNNSDDNIIIIDSLTYSGNLENIPDNPRVKFINEDIRESNFFKKEVDCIVNFAAETHVDRSITDPGQFVKTDILGTHNLLEVARREEIRYIQISTDEVYGSIEEGSFTEESPINPSSPYSASKTGADMLVHSYYKTYGLDAIILRASNNYGPRQYPEKLIPITIINALTDNKIPVYGEGNQVRNWLYVEDFCSAIDLVISKGISGEVYNVGGPEECTNIEAIRHIIFQLDKEEDLIEFVKDRPGHDFRYSLGSKKIERLGWEPLHTFYHGIDLTIEWYLENQRWWEKLLTKDYKEYYLKQYGKYRKD